MNSRTTLTSIIAILLFSTLIYADEPKEKKATETGAAAQDVFIKIPDIKGETDRASTDPAPTRMNKGEIISEVAEKPVVVEKRSATVRRTAVIAPAAPAPQADGDDNSNTKSGGINTIRSECTLEEKLKGDKICKKD